MNTVNMKDNLDQVTLNKRKIENKTNMRNTLKDIQKSFIFLNIYKLKRLEQS